MKRYALIISFAVSFVGVLACSGLARAKYINGTTLPPAKGPTPDETCLPMGKSMALSWGYCDVASALFSYTHVDMTLPGPMPIVLQRFYRSEAYDKNGAAVSYPFGPGTNFYYNMFLWSESEDANGTLNNVDLILPDGGRVFCGCTGSSCTPPNGSEFKCTATPSQTFYSATIQYVATPQSWVLTTKDGTQYSFTYGQSQGTFLQSITDRYGNQITINRQMPYLWKISSSNGRYVLLNLTSINGTAVITQAQDNFGRMTSYQYNSNGWMTQSTDLNNYNTTYTWYTAVDLGSITLKAVAGAGGLDQTWSIGYTNSNFGYQFTYLTPPINQGYFQIAYSTNPSGQVTQADLYDPKAIARSLAFNGSVLSDQRDAEFGPEPV
jgi:hypothetical protein